MNTQKAFIAMSGGVDSSVAARRMQEQGYDCIGATMRLFENSILGDDGAESSCCSLDDVMDAKKVCDSLGIPHYTLNFTEAFKTCVMDNFVASYENGVTPNPCIDCNRELKFARFFAKGMELECDKVVTGHYARIAYDEITGKYKLKKAVDLSKDQSYVLYNLTQDQLAHTSFPLGEFTKTEARAIAEKYGFVNAHKKESQDICFVPDGNYKNFIRRYTGKDYPAGDFVLEDGRVLGQHEGIISYTIGQRKHLGIAWSCPLYVKELDIPGNRVILTEDESLPSYELVADNVNIISGDPLCAPIKCAAKIRYRQTEQPATAFVDEDGLLHVTFDEPQRAITRGQAVVLYDGDDVIGGGRIISA